MIRLSATLALCAAILAVGPAPSALAKPMQVTLHLDGSHPLDGFHVGTFTGTSPLCSSGSWQGHGNGTRTFTCADGTGTFLAHFTGALEHVLGATGPWSITEGTGTYASLRGRGSAHIDSSVGSDDDTTGPRPTFSDTWTGVVDFDTTEPTGSITAVRVTRPHAPPGRWRAMVFFSAQDNVAANPVSFSATAIAGTFYASRSGTVTGRTASFTVAFHRAARTHYLRVSIELSDPWDNTRTISRDVRLK
jgi:hypothetical protein